MTEPWGTTDRAEILFKDCTLFNKVIETASVYLIAKMLSISVFVHEYHKNQVLTAVLKEHSISEYIRFAKDISRI